MGFEGSLVGLRGVISLLWVMDRMYQDVLGGHDQIAQGVGSWWILDCGFWLLDPESRILNPGPWILNPGFWILNLGSCILEPRSWIVVRESSWALNP